MFGNLGQMRRGVQHGPSTVTSQDEGKRKEGILPASTRRYAISNLTRSEESNQYTDERDAYQESVGVKKAEAWRDDGTVEPLLALP